ncbi:BON domain-containing protein [Streptomyces sp. NPDC087903]|uniref:BON domain-containing protein n=1 Tax=Streptomyces sp. NPDC087903 TaxID=3365819 RepID=UPI0038049C09
MNEPVANVGGAAGNVEYRIAHLREHLAAGELAELGVQVEVRAGSVVITGTVPSAHCRDSLLRTARQSLEGIPLHDDIVVAETARPDHAEDLS